MCLLREGSEKACLLGEGILIKKETGETGDLLAHYGIAFCGGGYGVIFSLKLIEGYRGTILDIEKVL